MATGQVSKDSWSRYEASSMLYDATLPAQKPSQKVSLPTAGPDTIDVKMRLKKEIVDKLESKGLELSHESYVAVVQVGKYMFMAIMLPVYFCCYGMPRWFFANALPQLFLGMKKQIFAVGKMIAEARKRVSDLMKGMIEQLIGGALKIVKDRARNFRNHFQESLAKFSNPIKLFFKNLSGIRQNAKARFKNSARLYIRAEEQVRDMNQRVAGKILEKWLYLQTIVLNRFNQFDQSILTPTLSFIAKPFMLLGQAAKSLKNGLSRASEALKQRLKKVTEPVVSLGKKVSSKSILKIKKEMGNFIEPFKSWTIEKKEILDVYLQPVLAVFNPFIQAGAALRCGFNAFVKKGSAAAKKGLSVPKSVLKFAYGLVPGRLKQKMNEKRKLLFDFGASLKHVAKGAVLGSIEIARLGFNFIKKILSSFLFIYHFLKKSYQWFAKQMAAVPGMLFQWSKFAFKRFFMIIGRVLFVFQVLIALIVIAFLDGLQELES